MGGAGRLRPVWVDFLMRKCWDSSPFLVYFFITTDINIDNIYTTTFK